MTAETSDQPSSPPRVALLLPIVLLLSKAADWIHVERSAPASEQFARLTFGRRHLGHVLTGLEQISVLRPSG